MQVLHVEVPLGGGGGGGDSVYSYSIFFKPKCLISPYCSSLYPEAKGEFDTHVFSLYNTQY